MRQLRVVLVFALALAACSGGAGSPAGSTGPPGLTPGASPIGPKADKPYEFWFINDDATATLHVWNTYGGDCTTNQLPRIDLAPGAHWSGVLDTVNTGLPCAVSDKSQDMLLWFDHDINSGNFSEIFYFKRFGTEHWHVQRIGGNGGFKNAYIQAPIKTHCQRNAAHIIICSAGNT